MSFMEHTQMDGKPPVDQAKQAIKHVLEQIHTHPEVGYFMGYGTQSFALLTEAAATLFGNPVLEVRQHFLPRKPRDPYAPKEES